MFAYFNPMFLFLMFWTALSQPLPRHTATILKFERKRIKIDY